MVSKWRLTALCCAGWYSLCLTPGGRAQAAQLWLATQGPYQMLSVQGGALKQGLRGYFDMRNGAKLIIFGANMLNIGSERAFEELPDAKRM